MGSYTGAQIRMWRKHRGMSQAVLAGLAGVSQGYVSQIESGLRTVERRSTLLAIAQALQVPAAELVSAAEHIGVAYAPAHASIAAVRTAVAELETGGRGPRRRDRDQVVAAMDDVDRRILTGGDWAGTIPYLADILLDAATIGGGVYARAAEQIVSPLLALGYRDLAWHAASFALRVARETGQTAWVGAAACSLTFALPVDVRNSARVARIVADELQPHAADPEVRQMYGQLQLIEALAHAVADRADLAGDRLDEAGREAVSLGDPVGAGFALKQFSSANVGYWRMSVASELGEHDRVVELAAGVDPRVFAGPSLPCFYWLHLGRSLIALGRDGEALPALVNSEQAAPQIFQHSRQARDAVLILARRARRTALPGTLRRLVQAVGADNIE